MEDREDEEKYSGFRPDEIESLHDVGLPEEFEGEESAGIRRDTPYKT